MTPSRFEFATATRIVFGAGTLAEAAPIVAGLGRKALTMGSGTPARVGALEATLRSHIDFVTVAVRGEPTVYSVREVVATARDAGADVVVAIGGGSVLDCGKAVAALLANGGDPLDYMEVVGRGMSLTRPSLPMVAIPTTAGAGTEVTRNAVLVSPEHGVKASMRSPFMLPRVALVDPILTFGLPPEITASTGMDALAQLVEPFVSIRANPIADAFCRDGMARVARSLRAAYHAGDSSEARADMALASLYGGMALANAGLGAVHGFASVLGGMLGAPHGALCAALLPHVMAVNVKALTDRQPRSPALARYREVDSILTGHPGAAPGSGFAWVEDLCSEVRIPRLRSYGLTPWQFDDVVARTSVASSTKANPIELATGDLREVLERAY